jgi:hypothetical protein
VEGVVISADSNDPNEMLGHFLIGRGLATSEQVRDALEVQERSMPRPSSKVCGRRPRRLSSDSSIGSEGRFTSSPVPLRRSAT